ncbi:Fanconi anemia group D2 protein isoform X2 [Neocloeon triangulifer]|uniref:Fanconi anemia group D2 protein isoform X2 n=1 Tax=Neocloeon triangulifer TaxID=2078957 RepID=UPI00286ECA32|nr:Fanconi anemia group D2 protein isoform X2 [Neocloeon triangulifer]
MYRNRFKKKLPLSKTSNVSEAGDSTVSSITSAFSNDKDNNTEAETTTNVTPPAKPKQTTNVTPPAKPKQTRKQQEQFPTEHTFLSPAPSPKLRNIKTPPRRLPMKDANQSSPVLNITRRKPKRVHDPDVPFFNRILASCGLKFVSEGDEPHTLDQEQVYFVRELQEAMERPENGQKFDEFIETFVDLHNNDPRLFKKSLLPTKRTLESGVVISHESLIHLLLEVTIFQGKIFDFIFERLLENVTEDNERKTVEGLNCIGWTKLLIHQLVELSVVENPEQLTEKLLECFQYCQMPKVQKEFLHAFPSIIYMDSQKDVAKCLSKVLKEGGENTPLILDALCDMAASTEVKLFITESVVDMLKQDKRKFLPQLVSFLLANARYEDDKAAIIYELRDHANLTPFGFDDEKLATDKAMLKKAVAQIGCGLNAMQEIGDLWLVTITNAKELKPIDVIVLVCLYSETTKKKLLPIVKSKCSAGVLTEELIDKTFLDHGDALSEYFDNIIEIASYLIKVPDIYVSRLGGQWFKLLFLHLEASFLRQKLMWCLINLLGGNSQRATESVLLTLSILVNNHMDEVLPQAALLMVPESLLDKVEVVSLEHARKIMDIVCQLAYSGHPQAEMLQGDINIMIQKQLRSLDNQVKRKGVIGAIMASKHIATSNKEATNTSDLEATEDGRSSRSSDCSSVAILSEKNVPAKNLLELAMKSTSKSYELNGFFYDELASMLHTTACLSTNFVKWLYNSILDDFEEHYLWDIGELEEKSSTIPKDVKLSCYLAIKGQGDNYTVNIGHHVLVQAMKASGLKVDKGSCPSEVWNSNVLCPMFRLLRIACYLGGDLEGEDIGAIIASHVLMPKNILSVTRGDFVSMSDPLLQVCILNTLFITVNWLRELVNAFCTGPIPELKEKVIQRIRQIVVLEAKILELMPSFPPDYVPPTCQFYTTVVPPKRGLTAKKTKRRKRKGKKKSAATQSTLHPALDEDNNETDLDEDTDLDDDEPLKDSSTEYSLKDLSAYFRELDMATFVLLQHKFVLDPTPFSWTKTSSEMGPAELFFLLDDYCQKLEHALDCKPGLLHSKSAKAMPFGFGMSSDEKINSSIKASTILYDHLDMYDKKLIAKNSVNPVKFVCDIFEKLVQYFEALQTKNDGLRDGPGSESETSKQLQKCMHKIICSLKHTLSWSGFFESDNLELVQAVLKLLATRVAQEEDLASTAGIVSHACKYIANFSDYIMTLPTAVDFIDLLLVINCHDPDQKGELASASKRKIYELSMVFFKQEWPPVAKDSLSAAHLATCLLQTLLKNCNNPVLKCLKILKRIDENKDDLKGKNCSGKIDQLPLITKSSLPHIYKTLSKTIVEAVRDLASAPQTSTQGGDIYDELIYGWRQIVESVFVMKEIAKHHETKPIFTTFIKDLQPIFRHFMDTAMPMMDKCFSKKSDELAKLLKKLQDVTRFTQHLCNHGKRTNFLGLVSQMPNMKFLLEKLVQRVKAMLVVNRCAGNVEVGSLKNKNLQGEDVPSQIGALDSDEEEEREAQRLSRKTQKTQKSQKSPTTQAKRTQKSQASKTQRLIVKTQKPHKTDKTQPSTSTQDERRKNSRKMHKHRDAAEEMSIADEEGEVDIVTTQTKRKDAASKETNNAKKQKKVSSDEESDIEEEREREIADSKKNKKVPQKKKEVPCTDSDEPEEQQDEVRSSSSKRTIMDSESEEESRSSAKRKKIFSDDDSD